MYASVRKEKDVENLKKIAKEKNLSNNFFPILMDVTNQQQIISARREIEKYVEKNSIPFIGVVNNAGVMFANSLEYTNLDSLRQLFEVNYVGVKHIFK